MRENVLIKIKGVFLLYAEMNDARLCCRREPTADYYLPNVPWMDDWWLILPLLWQSHRKERKDFPRTPQRRVTVMSARQPHSVTVDPSGRSVYVLYFSRSNRSTENKVFSLSKSSPNDIVVVRLRAANCLQELRSFHALGFGVQRFEKMASSCFEEEASMTNVPMGANRDLCHGDLSTGTFLKCSLTCGVKSKRFHLWKHKTSTALFIIIITWDLFCKAHILDVFLFPFGSLLFLKVAMS